ncbi:MAG: leucine-rich repeat domain-containing protein [Prevotella sp.]
MTLYVPNDPDAESVSKPTFHKYRTADIWCNYLLVAEDPLALEIDVADPGTLGKLVIENAGYLQEVNKLTVRGELNADDWSKMKDMSNLIEVDLSGLVNDVIPSSQFNGKWAITKVILPQNLKTINSYAFYSSGITEITFPETLETIGYESFENCDALTSVVLPNSVTSLGNECFYGCNNLREVTLSECLKSIPYYAFSYCDIRELTLPSSITTLGSVSFGYNTKLAKINFSENLQIIGSEAFYNCDSLKSVVMPESVRTIYSEAFSGCDKLENLVLNEGLERIEGAAFGNCDLLTEVAIPSSVTYCSSAFSSCDGLKNLRVLAIIPPTTGGKCPMSNVNLNDVTLHVPYWSTTEYLDASGWSQFKTVEPSYDMPQNIVINKDFDFALTQDIPEDYRPNINLVRTGESYNDKWGYSDYFHGNLTIGSRSKLPINDFKIIYSPYAKWCSDYDYWYQYNNGNEYWCNTPYNPTSLIVKGEMRAENVDLEMLLRKSEWQFISFPFDVNMSDIVPLDATTQWVIREYSGEKRAAQAMDETWVNVPSDGVLKAGKGYIMHCYTNNYYEDASDIVAFNVKPVVESLNRQAIFLSTDRNVTLEENLGEFEHDRSWNLIGNPYPSYYDTRFLDFTAPITVWNRRAGKYMAYSPVDDKYILAPGQAFFVQRPVDQESITFLNGGRQTYRHARTLEVAEAPSRAYMVMAPRTVYNILVKGDETVDRTRVVINEAATFDYELSRDAGKFMGGEDAGVQLFTLNGDVRYAINERPLGGGEVALGVTVGKAGSYTISLAEVMDGEVYLEDMLTGKFVKLNDESYTFTADAGELLNRFNLHFGPMDPTGIDAIGADNENIDKGVTLDGKAVSDSYKGIVVGKNRKSLRK